MTDTVISLQNVSKLYRLGLIGSSTVREDLHRWWRRVRRQPDPAQKIDLHGHRAERHAGDDVQDHETIWAVQNITFDVTRGRIVGIIGRNGAGKSTLLKILSRITAPTEGQIKVKGRIASLLEVGTGFHPELTGRENIFLNGAILGMSKSEIRTKFDEIVSFAGVDQYVDTPVKRYSSGMHVRLAFAVAAHLDPEILVVDEVLAVGDASFQKRCLGKMHDVAAEGRTVLFVSHNMAMVQSLCESGVWLDKGRMRGCGKTPDVVRDYLADVAHVVRGEPTDDLSGLTRDPGLEAVYVNGRIGKSPLVGVHTVEARGQIQIELTLHLSRPLRRCELGVHFETESAFRVLALNSRWVTKCVDLAPGFHTVRVSIPQFPLVAGTYWINLWLGTEGRVVDFLERVARLDVAATDTYGTGHLPHQGKGGYFLVDSDWKFKATPDRCGRTEIAVAE